MNKEMKNTVSLGDKLIAQIDHGLRSMFVKPVAERASPTQGRKDDPMHDHPHLKDKSASLMRVNHVGEVCAQALYQGQALTSRSPEVRSKMQEAAAEEIDHLNWCHDRVDQLESHTSYLNPFWYMGSFAIGFGAGLAGDKWSLGFLAETERQVVDHLRSHLDRLPEQDKWSRDIVEQMIVDETKHAEMAEENGAAALPQPLKKAMRLSAKLMTGLSEKI